MFTGIIEASGIVRNIILSGTNKTFIIESAISQELKPDQSVAHNGVCLTVEEVSEGCHRVTAIGETLKKSNLGALKEGAAVNLERCMLMNGRIDGHMVQGHVDATATCTTVTEKDGSWEYQFVFNEKFAALVIEKGSICLNGISLTVFDVKENTFRVAIIPYTYEHTNMKYLKEGDSVNVEFDIIGKYIIKAMNLGKVH